MLAFLFLAASDATAGYIEVLGGPEYNEVTQTGYRDGDMPYVFGSYVSSTGTAVGYAKYYDGGSDLDRRAVRWDAGGTAATELDNLGTDGSGVTRSEAHAVNDGGTIVGHAQKYDGGTDLGQRAVRWDAGGTAATELGNLGTYPSGRTNSGARAVNAGGTAVGYAYTFAGSSNLGARAVRWEAGGTAATELGHIGTRSDGKTEAYANALNNVGTAVGLAWKYVGGTDLGYRAVRWDAGGTAATELGNLGTGGSGSTSAQAVAVNEGGTAVGYGRKYVGGSYLGGRAVRWDAGGTTATELDNLGTDGSGSTASRAHEVNNAGTAVGYAVKYVGGNSLGERAVRWDAGGTAATEHGNLGTNANGGTGCRAQAVNNAGTAVGFCATYSAGGSYLGHHAVMWGSDALAVDLNTLIDPNNGWTLTRAYEISEHGLWIGGYGSFDPDLGGPLQPYQRLFLMQVPEPSTFALLAVAVLGLLAFRRRRP